MNSLFIFWTSLLLISYVYGGYLGLSIFLGWLFSKPVKQEDIFPKITLLIAAFNEQGVIKEKLDNSLKLDYPEDKIEIVVCSESSDQTNKIVSEYASCGVKLFSYQKRQGKSAMIYKTISKISGEIIVFSDANAIYEEDALKKISRNFTEKNIGAVVGRLNIINPEESAVSQGESLYKKYEALLRKSNSQMRSVLGVDGSMFAIRRSVYLPISADRGDDFELAVRILIKGFGVVFEPEAISYEKGSVREFSEVKRKVRIVSWFLKSSFILLKEMVVSFKGKLIFQLISHKILRWFSPFFFISLLVSSFFLQRINFFYGAAFYSQIIFYLFGLVGWGLSGKTNRKIPGILKIPVYFLVFNYAFIVGVFQGLFRKQKPFWETSQR